MTRTNTPDEGSGPPASADPVTVAGVRLTTPDKVLFPASGKDGEAVTKLDLARYYVALSERVLAHAAGRPLTLVRCPHGSAQECFYQRHPDASGAPPAMRTVEITGKEGPTTYMYIASTASLVSLVQMDVLEIHTWNSRVESLEKPDRMVLDLDPGSGVGWGDIVEASLRVRDVLHSLGLGAFAKTTGSRGIHVVTPIEPTVDHDTARAVARAVAERIAEQAPERFTVKMSKRSRAGRVFIDYLRNAHGASAVALFSTRARPGAPVAVPVTWDELEGDFDPKDMDVMSVPERVAALREDPWEGYEGAAVRLDDSLFATLGIERPRS